MNQENRENEDFDESIWEVVQGDVVQMAENGAGRFSKVADVVVTNPPFGTKSNEGIDMKFLEAAQDRFHEFSLDRPRDGFDSIRCKTISSKYQIQ